jgi:PAS domain S-box-containing protein
MSQGRRDSESPLVGKGAVRQQAGEALVAQDPEELLANIIEFLPDATFVIDLDKRVVAWNRACEIMTGVKKEALLGQGDYAYAEAFIGERRPILIDLLDMPSPETEASYKYVKRKGDVIYAESFVPRLRGGEGAHLWGEAAPLFDRQGRRCGAVEVVRDVTEQKRVEQSLQENRERLLKVQRVARVGFLDWDLKTNEIFLSDETCELTGFRPDGQVTTPDFVVRSVHPDDVAYAGENLNLAIQGIKPYDIVHRHLRPDGGIVWVHAQAEISRDENGAPARLLGTIVDITEQKRVEQALRDNERKYRELVEHANSIILHWSRDGRILFLNEFGQRFFGYTEEEIRGRHVMGTIVPETERSGRDLRSLMDDICRTPEAFQQNVNENMRRNGEHVWIAWTNKVVLDHAGQVAEILSIGADITERRRAEQALRESELKHRTLFETAGDAIFLMRNDRFIDCNRRTLALFGCSREQIVGAPPYQFSPPFQPDGRSSEDKALEKINLALTEGPQSFEWEHCRPDGSPFPAEVSLNRLEIGGETLVQAIVRDITERKQAEASLQRLNLELEGRVEQRTAELFSTNEQLRTKNVELKDFAYTVSHDLKAPLRGIAGYANELDRKHRAGLGDRAQFCLTQILTATSHLDQLIEDLLHYSRLDTETPSVTEVNLRDLVDGILQDRNLTITEQHVDVTVDIPVATVQTWQRGLVQIVTNLVDNAIKYSRKASPPRLRIAAAILDGAWLLTVSDNGIGFDMQYHDRIFGLFNRLVRMEDYEGTGAGLAIVRKVVDKQGGRIWAVSAPGQGATFSVEMPMPRDRK